MKLRRMLAQPEDRGLSITAMIDVTFLLLIFFLCTLSFRTLDQRLSAHLPRNDGGVSDSPSVAPLDLVIEVREAGIRDASGAFAGRTIAYRLGPHRFADPRHLGTELLHQGNLNPERRVVIDARAGTVVQDVVSVVDLALEAGIHDIGFAGTR